MAGQDFRIEEVGGFRLFMPALEGLEEVAAHFRAVQRRNREFIAARPAAPACRLRITGSFIAAHAPDYVGVPTLDWDAARWQTLFQAMKRDGIDTAVFQASLWHELGECYYPTRRFAGEYRVWNVVEPMLEAARACDMTLFLGTYGSVAGWREGRAGLDAARREIDRQIACLEELLQWRDGFAGLYFAPETAFRGRRVPETEAMLNLLYRTFFRQVRALAPGKPILISPGSKFFPGMDEDFLTFWRNVLRDAVPDILAPQDSVGCGGCTLENQSAMWRLWKVLADSLPAQLWSNVELFERREFGGPAPFERADEARLGWQLAHEAPFVSKAISWEYATFGKFPKN